MNHKTIRHKAGIIMNNAGNVYNHHYPPDFFLTTYYTTAILTRLQNSFYN